MTPYTVIYWIGSPEFPRSMEVKAASIEEAHSMIRILFEKRTGKGVWHYAIFTPAVASGKLDTRVR